MLYQLPDGRTVYLSISEYLDMSDQDLKDLISYNIGIRTNNPMYGSVLNNPENEEDYIEESFEEEELGFDILNNLNIADDFTEEE